MIALFLDSYAFPSTTRERLGVVLAMRKGSWERSTVERDDQWGRWIPEAKSVSVLIEPTGVGLADNCGLAADSAARYPGRVAHARWPSNVRRVLSQECWICRDSSTDGSSMARRPQQAQRSVGQVIGPQYDPWQW